MDYVFSLKRRLADNEASIASLKERLASLEMEQHRLAIALEVVASLALQPSSPPVNPRAEMPAQLVFESVSSPAPERPRNTEGRRAVKDLILSTLEEAGFPLTRMDVVSRLVNAGHHLNSTSVGSTLSRLVDAGAIEKASHSQYRIKQMPALTRSDSPQ